MRKFLAVAIAAALFVAGMLAGAQQNDPSPRFEILGRELLETPNSGSPAKVFVYRDKATGAEILCFSGEFRETLSCLLSGRNRGKQ